MALDLCQNFLSAHYLENKLTDFTKFCICIHIDKIQPGIDGCHFLNICTRVMAFDLSQNFVCVQYLELLILTRSMLGLLAVKFRKNVRELWPLIDVRISLNILRNYGLFLHTKHCSGAIVKFSDNSS